eukprot:SAG22_NODE_1633_length_3930_cov_1.860872_4_plen_256_part_00
MSSGCDVLSSKNESMLPRALDPAEPRLPPTTGHQPQLRVSRTIERASERASERCFSKAEPCTTMLDHTRQHARQGSGPEQQHIDAAGDGSNRRDASERHQHINSAAPPPSSSSSSGRAGQAPRDGAVLDRKTVDARQKGSALQLTCRLVAGHISLVVKELTPNRRPSSATTAAAAVSPLPFRPLLTRVRGPRRGWLCWQPRGGLSTTPDSRPSEPEPAERLRRRRRGEQERAIPVGGRTAATDTPTAAAGTAVAD